MLKNYLKDFDKFIGQDKNMANLLVYINAAVIQKKQLDHIFLYSQSGMGKSTLAKLIANKINKKIYIYYANNFKKPSDLFSCFTKIKEHEILFIDEIHRLNSELEEYLFPVLESNSLSITLGKGYSAKIVNIKLAKFTIICATTELHKINEQLLNRFPIFVPFEQYNFDNIKLITKNLFEKYSIEISNHAIEYFVTNTKYNPRIINNIFQRIYDYIIVDKISKISYDNLRGIFLKLNIFENGINEIDIQYLKTLIQGPCSIKTIKQLSNFPLEMILNKIEPNLLKNFYIKKTSRGRILTEKGYDFLQKLDQKI